MVKKSAYNFQKFNCSFLQSQDKIARRNNCIVTSPEREEDAEDKSLHSRHIYFTRWSPTSAELVICYACTLQGMLQHNNKRSLISPVNHWHYGRLLLSSVKEKSCKSSVQFCNECKIILAFFHHQSFSRPPNPSQCWRFITSLKVIKWCGNGISGIAISLQRTKRFRTLHLSEVLL